MAVLLAVWYNVFLSVLFSAVLFTAMALRGGRGGMFIWYEFAGFVFLYFVLGAVCSDSEGKIDEYGVLGFISGLVSYIVFAAHAKFLRCRLFADAYALTDWMMNGWVGGLMAALAVLEGLLYLIRLGFKGVALLFKPLMRLTRERRR